MSISGLMKTNTRVIGLMVNCTVKVYFHIKMVENMRGNMKMIKKMDKAQCSGRMEKYTLVFGKMEKNMVKE